MGLPGLTWHFPGNPAYRRKTKSPRIMPRAFHLETGMLVIY